ncbi:MAG TPA: glycosyltransferase family 39 protein, partial [Terriglobales bacterium]|nr:glycosyltransferase family 39 protein [Terriglobales bacterium]
MFGGFKKTEVTVLIAYPFKDTFRLAGFTANYLLVNRTSSPAVEISSQCNRHVSVAIVLWFIAGLLLFSVGVSRTQNMVFDEANYLPIARSLLHGDLKPLDMNSPLGRQHPPLGSYLIAAGIKVGGDSPIGWRLASILAGSLTLSAMFLWVFLLIRDFRLAMTAAALTLLNHFLYVIARVAMLDIFEFMFVMWALVAFTASVTTSCSVKIRRGFLFLSGILFGLACACKWNAIDSLLVVLLISVLLLASRRLLPHFDRLALALPARSLREIGLSVIFAALLIVPVVTYFCVFFPFLHAMYTPFSFQ